MPASKPPGMHDGDVDVFLALVERHRTYMYDLALRLTGPRTGCEGHRPEKPARCVSPPRSLRRARRPPHLSQSHRGSHMDYRRTFLALASALIPASLITV